MYTGMKKKQVADYMKISVRQLDGFLKVVKNYYDDFGKIEKNLTAKQVGYIDQFFDLDITGVMRGQNPGYKPIYFFNIYRKKDFAKLENIHPKRLQRQIMSLRTNPNYSKFLEHYEPKQKILSVFDMFLIDHFFVYTSLYSSTNFISVLYDFNTTKEFLEWRKKIES